MKICSECAHFKAVDNIYNPHVPQREPSPECAHPAATTRDLIYGRALCHNERASTKGCGRQGKLWEAKP